MFDIESIYEAKSVGDAVRALNERPDAELISGGTDVLTNSPKTIQYPTLHRAGDRKGAAKRRAPLRQNRSGTYSAHRSGLHPKTTLQKLKTRH